MEEKTRAIGLFSGGLDSIIAAKLVMEQGIDVELVNFTTVFFDRAFKESVMASSQKAAEGIGKPLTVIDISAEFFDVLGDPAYGYGSAMNPCIDCRISMLKKAKRYMTERRASFVFTGEVLGQRPFSQRRDAMKIIERESGLKGFLLRPLSARLMPQTVAEEKGIIDRSKLLSLSGRSRKPQMALAKRFGIEEYPASGGLTEKEFAAKLRDLMKHKPDFDAGDIELLKHGRHFRISPTSKLVVGRYAQENHRIAALARKDDVMFHAQDPLGPVCLLRGADAGSTFEEAVSILARYALGKGNTGTASIRCFSGLGEEIFLNARPCKESFVEDKRI
jgi:tRNA U34 2-thiouridine synthase MnmA/TrmU